MRLPPFYVAWCLLILILFGYTKYRGLDFGTATTGNSSTGLFHYVGTSSSFHK